jgi:hypothetical protein
MMFGFGQLKKKVKVVYMEEGEPATTFDTHIIYKKDEKKWYLKLKKEEIPCPENVFNFLYGNCLFVVRKGLNEYSFADMKKFISEGKIEEYTIPPHEFYTAILNAQLRAERMKTNLEKILPIAIMIITLIGVGVFIAIVWSTTGQNMAQISANFDSAMKVLQNLTMEQNNLIRELKGGGVLLPTK